MTLLPVLSIPAAAALASVSRATIYNAIARGELTSIDYGNHHRMLSRVEMEKWVVHRQHNRWRKGWPKGKPRKIVNLLTKKKKKKELLST